MSSHPKSVANVKFDLFGFTFGVKVLSAVVEQTLSEVQVHGCGRLLSFGQRCPHCNHKQKAVVAGGSAPRPKKTCFCTNKKCGKEITGAPVEKAHCESCGEDVEKDMIKLGHKHGETITLLTDEQRTQVEKLRMPRGIRATRAHQISDLSPPLLVERIHYQLVPDKGSDQHFEALVSALEKGGYALEVLSTLSEEKATFTLKNEHGGIVRLNNGALVLTTFYAPRDVSITAVPRREIAQQARQDLFTLVKMHHKPFSGEGIAYETPGSRALWAHVMGETGAEQNSLPHPADEKAESVALAAQLQNALDAAAEAEKQSAKANKRAEKSKAKKEKADAK